MNPSSGCEVRFPPYAGWSERERLGSAPWLWSQATNRVVLVRSIAFRQTTTVSCVDADRPSRGTISVLGMTTSTADARSVTATRVSITEDTLAVDLSDGRSISVPLAWHPRLVHGTADERNQWRLIGSGRGIHWPDLDEDISVENLLSGNPSAESQQSLKKWLRCRNALVDSSQSSGQSGAPNSP
jgi:hypothetical protein